MKANMDEEGREYQEKKDAKSGKIYRYYLDEGAIPPDWWVGIQQLNREARERLGFPTQKPEALLERIIKASSNEGDLVLDPFCGCGTTVSVAERLNRQWVGIDVTMLAINLVRHRLSHQFSEKGISIYVDGRPRDISGAEALFKKNPFEFEYWVLDMVDAVPAQSKTKENMRGADKGVDGVINFIKDVQNGDQIYGKLLVQVKGGTVHRDDIATLKGDVERERADGGVLVTLEKPTKPMREETVSAGSYKIKFGGEFEFPKIQILTIEDLLSNKKPKVPIGALKYYKEAKPVKEIKQTKGLDI
jgi:site-specific DNA-methyltransferase (adenine-specific)